MRIGLLSGSGLLAALTLTVTLPLPLTQLRIELLSGSGLLAADKNGLSDPYVVLRLGGKRKRSKTLKRTLEPECGRSDPSPSSSPSPSPSPSPRTLEPEWNEMLEFKGVHVREATSLTVSVYDADLIGRDDFLGELP